MAGLWRVAAVCVAVAAAVATQDLQHRREGGGQESQRGGVRLIGRQHLGRTRAADVVGTGGADLSRRLTRLERRRLREERRQARLDLREERRRQKQDGRRGGGVEVEAEGNAGRQGAATGEAEVDLAWLSANLSSLWQEFRTFTARSQVGRGQGRGQHGGGGRAQLPVLHVNGVEEEDHTCPTGVESCRAEEGQVCSGYGECWCGHCRCEQDHYGSFCQCNDHICQMYDGMSCGGPSRGQCRCGGCMCRPGYMGEACGCPTDTNTCIQPGQEGSIVCSNKGTCECGRCRCEDGYKGMYCEDTVYAAGVCEKLRSCVLCQAFRRDLPRCGLCQVTLNVVESLEPSMTTCVMVNSGCIMKYSYETQDDNSYNVVLQHNVDCPPQIE